MINIKNFDPSLLKIERKSYKNIDIYYIGSVTKKVSMNIHSVNPLYFIDDKVDGFIKKKEEESKYLNFVSKDNNDEVLKKYIELWDGIKNLIQKIDNSPGKYGNDYMKIKFNSYDNLILNKALKLHNLTTIFRSVFQENNMYYSQYFFRRVFA